jgi:RNA polymerase sigma-70 factor (ECF subfamily)
MATSDPAGVDIFAAGQFRTTHWSVVLTAGNSASPEAHSALEDLCRTYWYPLYAYVRRRGYSPEDAQDLTQSFFAQLLRRNAVTQVDRQRGKFRTFLLASLNNFLTDQWDQAHRVKRGGGETTLSFDAVTAEERCGLEPADVADPAKLFERRWAVTLLEHCLTLLEEEMMTKGQRPLFEALRPFLVGEPSDQTYSQLAPPLGITPSALKMSASRLRARCRELLREEILRTVASPREAEEEHEQSIDDGIIAVGGDVWLELPADRHNQGCNLSFFDGHVEAHHWLAPKRFKTYNQPPSSTDGGKDRADLCWWYNRTDWLAIYPPCQ